MTAEKIIGILSDMYSKYVTLFQLAKEKKEAIMAEKSDQIIFITTQEEKTALEIETLEKDRVNCVGAYLKTLNLNEKLSLTELLNAGFFKDKAGDFQNIKKSLVEIMHSVKLINDENIALINASKEIIDATLDYIKNKILKQHNPGAGGNGLGTYSKQSVLNKSYKSSAPPASVYVDSQNVMLNFKV